LNGWIGEVHSRGTIRAISLARRPPVPPNSTIALLPCRFKCGVWSAECRGEEMGRPPRRERRKTRINRVGEYSWQELPV